MKRILLFTLLTLNFSSASIFANEVKIIDDIRICGPVMNNNFKKLQSNLKKYFQTTLSESYFSIECRDADLLNLVIKSPRERYFTYLHMQRYFEKKEKTPEIFSRILLHEVDGRNALLRIEKQIHLIKETSLAGTEYEEKLLKLMTKIVVYLKKYPIAGSDEAISVHL